MNVCKKMIDGIKTHKAKTAAVAATLLAGPQAGVGVLAIAKMIGEKGKSKEKRCSDKSDGCTTPLKNKTSSTERKQTLVTHGRSRMTSPSTPVVCSDSDVGKFLRGGYLGYFGVGDSTAARMRRNANLRQIDPPPIGTPLLVPLGVYGQELVEHTGIYLGNGQIAELRGDGKLLSVSLNSFLNGRSEYDRLDPRVGTVVFAACDAKTGNPIGNSYCADNARRFIEEIGAMEYSVKSNNCHMFTISCVNNQIAEKRTGFSLLGRGIYTIRRLTNDLMKKLNGGALVEWFPVKSMNEFVYAPSKGKVENATNNASDGKLL